MNLGTLEEVLLDVRRIDPRAVPDGAVVPERYACARPRIVWILREVNDSGNTDWDLRTFLASDDPETGLLSYSRWWSTYGFVAKMSRALREGPDSTAVARLTAAEARDSLRDIAVINVNKSRGSSSAHWPTLRKAALVFGPVLRRQVQILQPEVVIAAGTWELLEHAHFGLPEVLGSEAAGVTRQGGTYWVRAPHPCRMR